MKIDFIVPHNPKPWVIYVRHTKRSEAKRAPKRKYAEWREKRIVEAGRGNPDLDNMRKSTIDALQEVVIDNDCMVIAGAMSKQYVRERDGAPYAHIIISTGEDINDRPTTH